MAGNTCPTDCCGGSIRSHAIHCQKQNTEQQGSFCSGGHFEGSALYTGYGIRSGYFKSSIGTYRTLRADISKTESSCASRRTCVHRSITSVETIQGFQSPL